MNPEPIRIPMRDGVRLHARMFRPDGDGPWPVVLLRTPYDPSGGFAEVEHYPEHGYLVVVQSCRGLYGSEGSFYPWHQEAADGHDTLEWIGTQPWCNSRIGMQGASYSGLVQWLAAMGGSRYLKAIAPIACPADFWRELNYMGGAFRLGLSLMWASRMWHRCHRPETESLDPPLGEHLFPDLLWQLPLVDADRAIGSRLPAYRDWLAHPSYDDYWRALSNVGRFDRIRVPALIISGWFDSYVRGGFENYHGLVDESRKRDEPPRHKVLVGAWRHGDTIDGRVSQVGEMDFGSAAPLDVREPIRRWFDHWLRDRDSGMLDEPPIAFFTMGANAWRTSTSWPPATARATPLFLHSGGRANTASGDGALSFSRPDEEPADHYMYDPVDPVPSRGSYCMHPGLFPEGPHDQRAIEERADVLVYSSEPLTADVEVTGPVKLHLYASSSALDTDFTARLVDVFPDGAAYNLCEGIVRARYRDAADAPTLMEPGTVYPFTIDLQSTSNVFRRGHRIRLEVSSSNFPQFDRNPNTGHDFGVDNVLRTANQAVYHDLEYTSYLLLPIIPNSP